MAMEIQEFRVTFKTARLKALNTSPAVIISAPGVGKFTHIHSAVAMYEFGTIAYSVGQVVDLYYGGPTGQRTGIFGSILSGVVDTIWQGTPAFSGIDTVMIENQPLVLTTNGPDPISGDGIITLIVFYTIETLPAAIRQRLTSISIKVKVV